MNHPDDNPTELPAQAPEAEAAPKPARRPRKPKEVSAVDPEAVVVTEPEAESDSVDAAPKPARKRRAAPKAAVEDEASIAASPNAEPASLAPAAVPQLQEAVGVASPGVVFELSAPVNAAVAAESETAEGGAAGDPAAGDAPRSSRNRRRGRKDRQGERAEGGAGPDGAERSAAAAAPAVVAPDAGEVFAHVMSGEFDIEEEAEEATSDDAAPAQAPKRVLQAEPDAPKLHKVLAQSGVGSRRDMEALIEEGKVTVNDQPAHTGQRISFGDHIKIDGKPVRVRIVPPPPRIIAYHKPVGEVVTHNDPENRPTVFRRLPRLQQGKWQSVGRLDLNTEGLLLFTTSGELANQLMHPRFGVEREYAVRVLGTLNEDNKKSLLEGVDVEGQTASFKSIADGGGEGANHWYRVVITEGRNREVRKLFDAVGLTVSRLIRIRYGTVVLPRGLKRGVWVDLEEGDVRAIRRLASGGDGQRRDARPEGRGNEQQRGNERGRGNKPQQQRNDRQGQQGQQTQGRGDRNDRGPRPNRPPQGSPNPAQAQPRDTSSNDFDRDDGLDFDPSKIPNPLEQTFDKRFVQNPRGPAGGAGFGRGGGGFGAGGSAPPRAAKKTGGPREPDPLQTSVGYIGADAFHRRGGKGGGGGGGGGGNRGGGGGGGFGGGGGGNRGGGGGGGFGNGGGGGGRRGR